MRLLGYLSEDDPEYRKRCLDTWLECGSSIKAGKILGVGSNSVKHNAWIYLLNHPDEARVILNNEAENHPSKAYQDQYRNMNDQEFWTYLSIRAIRYFSATKFKVWVETYHPEQYGADRVYKDRYPKIYAEYHTEVS